MADLLDIVGCPTGVDFLASSKEQRDLCSAGTCYACLNDRLAASQSETLRLRKALEKILEAALVVHANEHMANFQCGVIAGIAQKALIEP